MSDYTEILTAEEILQIEKDATEAVTKRLQEFEQIDSRLTKTIEVARNEKKELDEQLRSLSRTQILEGHKARSLILQSNAKLQKLKQDFSAVSSVITGMKTATTDYTSLRRLFFARRNVQCVREYTLKLLDFQQNSKVIHEEVQNGNILEPYNMLRDILQIFVEAKASSVPPARHNKMMAVYKPYMDLAENLALSLTKKWSETMVHCFDIAIMVMNDDEEGPDAESHLQQSIEVYRIEQSKKILLTTGSRGDVNISTESMLEKVSESIDAQWEASMTGLGDGTGDLSKTLAKMVDFTNLMQYANGYLLEMFPDAEHELNMKHWLISTIHTKLYDQLEYFSKPINGLISKDLIQCVNWIATYLETLEKWDFKEVINLSSLYQLRNVLVNQAVTGMDRHMTDLCTKTACTTSTSPLEMTDGHVHTMGPMDLYQVLDQSLGSLLDVAPVSCKIDLAHAGVNAVRVYVKKLLELCEDDAWAERLEREAAEEAQGQNNNIEEPSDPELWRERRMQYACAFTNDVMKLIENIEEIAKRMGEDIAASVFDDYLVELNDEALQFLKYLADYVIWTLTSKPEGFNSCFDYDIDAMTRDIIPTLDSFMNDWKQVLDDSYIAKIANILLREITQAYLNMFFRKFADEKHFPAESWQWYQRDSLTLRKFFTEILEGRHGASNAYNLEAFHAIEELLHLTDSVGFAQHITQVIINYFPDCPTVIVQTILEKKHDASKSLTKECMEIWKGRIKNQERDAEDRPTKGVANNSGNSVLRNVPKELFLEKKKRRKEEEKQAKEIAKLKKEAEEEKKKKKGTKKSALTNRDTRVADVEVVQLSDILGGK